MRASRNATELPVPARTSVAAPRSEPIAREFEADLGSASASAFGSGAGSSSVPTTGGQNAAAATDSPDFSLNAEVTKRKSPARRSTRETVPLASPTANRAHSASVATHAMGAACVPSSPTRRNALDEEMPASSFPAAAARSSPLSSCRIVAGDGEDEPSPERKPPPSAAPRRRRRDRRREAPRRTPGGTESPRDLETTRPRSVPAPQRRWTSADRRPRDTREPNRRSHRTPPRPRGTPNATKGRRLDRRRTHRRRHRRPRKCRHRPPRPRTRATRRPTRRGVDARRLRAGRRRGTRRRDASSRSTPQPRARSPGEATAVDRAIPPRETGRARWETGRGVGHPRPPAGARRRPPAGARRRPPPAIREFEMENLSPPSRSPRRRLARRARVSAPPRITPPRR